MRTKRKLTRKLDYNVVDGGWFGGGGCKTKKKSWLVMLKIVTKIAIYRRL